MQLDDHSKPEKIGDVVVRAMEAMEASLANPPTEEEEKKFENDDRVNQKFERVKRMNNAGLTTSMPPLVVERIAWDKLEKTQSLAVVQAWLKTKMPFLFLTGPTGVGKTVAGAWAIAACGGMFVRAQTLERAGLAIFGPYEELLQRAYSDRLLFIDDLGTEFRVQEFTGVLSEVINNRQGGGLRTIFTSNLDRFRLEEKYFGARELSRLKEAAAYITDNSEDMRT